MKAIKLNKKVYKSVKPCAFIEPIQKSNWKITIILKKIAKKNDLLKPVTCVNLFFCCVNSRIESLYIFVSKYYLNNILLW